MDVVLVVVVVSIPTITTFILSVVCFVLFFCKLIYLLFFFGLGRKEGRGIF